MTHGQESPSKWHATREVRLSAATPQRAATPAAPTTPPTAAPFCDALAEVAPRKAPVARTVRVGDSTLKALRWPGWDGKHWKTESTRFLGLSKQTDHRKLPTSRHCPMVHVITSAFSCLASTDFCYFQGTQLPASKSARAAPARKTMAVARLQWSP